MYFVDKVGRRVVMIRKVGWNIVRVFSYRPCFDEQPTSSREDDMGATVYLYGEVVGTGTFGNMGSGLEFRLFTPRSNDSEPYLVARKWTGKTGMLEVLVLPASNQKEIAARITETDENGMTPMRDMFNNEFAIELAQGTDVLAVALLAVICDKTLDEAAQQQRDRRRRHIMGR